MIALSAKKLVISHAEHPENILNSSLISQCALDLVRLALANSSSEDFESTILLIEAHLRLFKYLELLHQMVMESDVGVYQSVSSLDDCDTLEENETDCDILFKNQFRDSGLVTKSDVILRNVYRFFLSGDLLSNSSPRKRSKGKSNNNIRDVANLAGLNAAKECFSFRNYQTSFRLVQLLVGQDFVFQGEGKSDIVDNISILGLDSLQHLLQNVLSTKNIDPKFALGCMLALPSEKAFATFKIGMALTSSDYKRLQSIASVGAVAGSIWSQRSFRIS